MSATAYGIRKIVMNRESLFLIAAAVATVGLIAGGGAWYDARMRESIPPPPTTAADVAAVEARTRLLQARVDAEPADAASWRELGRAYMDLGRYLEAVEAWSVVAEMRPGDREAAAAFARLDDIARARGQHRDQTR